MKRKLQSSFIHCNDLTQKEKGENNINTKHACIGLAQPFQPNNYDFIPNKC